MAHVARYTNDRCEPLRDRSKLCPVHDPRTVRKRGSAVRMCRISALSLTAREVVSC
jgi:hypothetical protein